MQGWRRLSICVLWEDVVLADRSRRSGTTETSVVPSERREGRADERDAVLGPYMSQALASLIGGEITFDRALGDGSRFALDVSGSAS